MKQKTEGINSSRERGGALLKLVVFLVLFTGVLIAAWVLFVPEVLTGTLRKRTGFPVKVTGLYFNPFNARVELKGFVLNNPPGFPRNDFMEITSFEANAKFSTLFSDVPEFDYARVEVAYVTLVRNADGVLNAQLFHDRLYPPPPMSPAEKAAIEQEKAELAKNPPAKVIRDGKEIVLQSEKKPAPKTKEAAAKEAAKDSAKKAKAAEKPPRYLIRHLEVRLQKVIVADHTVTPAAEREFNFRMYYTYKNVTDPSQLMAPFALKSLEPVGEAIRALIPGDLGRAMNAATQSGEKLFKPADERGKEDTLKTVVEKLEENQNP